MKFMSVAIHLRSVPEQHAVWQGQVHQIVPFICAHQGTTSFRRDIIVDVFCSFNPTTISPMSQCCPVLFFFVKWWLALLYFTHLFYWHLSVTACPSLVTVGVCCFVFQVGNHDCHCICLQSPIRVHGSQVSTAASLKFESNAHTLKHIV